ncbi:MAG TPA: ferrochelatase [Thermoanaerobaculia bacterium]|nr:ferrochelatase [Thermoanaerobaculia bacterium]
MARQGLLLVNLGTPDAPRTPEVRRYLREFLSDPRVFDMHPVKRTLILNLFILPFRPRRSAEAYRKVWTERGSPLLFHGEDLAAKLRARLGAEVPIALGMRYQSPSIGEALARLLEAGADRIVVFPLFPQYSSAAWGSAVERAFDQAGRLWNVPALQVVPPFYDHPAFLDAQADVASRASADFPPDYTLMSFHGLPERQVTKSDQTGGRHCLREGCCASIVAANSYCYRAQCFATARGIAERLGLAEGRWEVTFQSRLGSDPWIRPFTDERVLELAREGVRRVALMSPAFVADCLETLEELAIRAKEDFESHGGGELRLVPSLNSEEVWVDALLEIARDSTTLGAPKQTFSDAPERSP